MSKDYEGMGLTEEELAALTAPDDEDKNATQGELEDLAKATGTAPTTEAEGKENADDADKGAGGTAAGDDVAAGDAAAPAGAEAAAPTAAPTPEPSAAPSAPVQQAPLLVAQAPADAEQKLADIKTQKEALITKFDDGELSAKEMQQQLDALGKQEREIERAIDKAQIAAELESQRQKNQWDADCGNFLAAHPEYVGEANAEVFAHLNETIMAYAKMPRNANLTGPQLLDKAHKAVMLERGTPVADVKPDPLPGKKQVPIPKPALPPTLGGVPAAASNDPSEGKWASLDRLQTANPEAYEKALADMSDSERDKYLAA